MTAATPTRVPTKPNATRLYALLARAAPVGIIFRRGPSKQVLLIRWDLRRHRFEGGQWFKGRIYERRCDLSPSGEYLVYFAANFKAPDYSWTAVSRPPFLTALARWPKGDCWGGGGLFRTERVLGLNHGLIVRAQADGLRLPGEMRLEAVSPYAGRGEDDPLWSQQRLRDGWLRQQAGAPRENPLNASLWLSYPRGEIWTKARGSHSLEMRLLGLKERDGPWYVLQYRLLDAAGDVVHDLGRSDWADWSGRDEVLFARDGRLYRIALHARRGASPPEELIDLRAPKFENVAPPPRALRWGGRRPQGALLG